MLLYSTVIVSGNMELLKYAPSYLSGAYLTSNYFLLSLVRCHRLKFLPNLLCTYNIANDPAIFAELNSLNPFEFYRRSL